MSETKPTYQPNADNAADHTWPTAGTIYDSLQWPLTGPQRTADEIAALRGVVAALAAVQELKLRMAVVEHRLRQLEAAEVAA